MSDNYKYLNNSMSVQRLNDLAKKYNLVNYLPGQSFDSIKDNMSAEDYETSQKLLEYYTNQQTLTDEYNYNAQNIDKNRNRYLQENAISKDLTMKYLPEYLKLQGMGGLGVSESAIISANNDYRNARNSINSDADWQKAELLKNYQANMASLDERATAETNTIKNKYEEEAKINSANNLLSAQGILDNKVEALVDLNGKISQNAKASLHDYVETNYKDKLTDADYEQLKGYIEEYSATTAEEEKLINDQSYVMNNYGVDSYGLQGAILADDAGVTSFGSFKGTGNGKSQDDWVSTVINWAKNGNVKNGDVVDFNYGEGSNRYVYYEGYWYPTNKKANIKKSDLENSKKVETKVENSNYQKWAENFRNYNKNKLY